MDLVALEKLLPLLGTLVTVFGSVVIWSLTQRANRLTAEKLRREERYEHLLDSLRGFYIDSYDKNLRNEFLRQLNFAWMYCPDNVIKLAYKFLTSVHTGEKKADEEKEFLVGELVAAIRLDMAKGKLLSSSNLTAKDFRHLRAT